MRKIRIISLFSVIIALVATSVSVAFAGEIHGSWTAHHGIYYPGGIKHTFGSLESTATENSMHVWMDYTKDGNLYTVDEWSWTNDYVISKANVAGKTGYSYCIYYIDYMYVHESTANYYYYS